MTYTTKEVADLYTPAAVDDMITDMPNNLLDEIQVGRIKTFEQFIAWLEKEPEGCADLAHNLGMDLPFKEEDYKEEMTWIKEVSLIITSRVRERLIQLSA